MSIAYKCKCCAANLDVEEGMRLVKCPACRTKQTLPSSRDENIQNLFNRATTLRLKSEFDKAESVYERIIQADEEQYEAYWGLILCKFGVEYVEDPKTETRIPTCHRTSYESIIADENYKLALKYTLDEEQQALYKEEAKAIDEIQKGILEVAQNEEPYDVFICYKETDENGKRTQDSVIANDIYHQLTQEGFKVFYAAITLEGKLGSAYEPIIFAALNSAKVMLAVGTKPEYFQAVWVKNEWSRFLKMNKDNRNKMLIPCYKGMDPYDLPDEFAHLQAQDMGKIGFITDLIRGVKKILSLSAEKAGGHSVVNNSTVIVNQVNLQADNLIKRAFIALEDRDFNGAKSFAEEALNIDAEYAEAYLIKALYDLMLQRKEDLLQSVKCYENANFIKAARFAKGELKELLDKAEKACFYNKAKAKIDDLTIPSVYDEVKALLAKAGDYQDAQTLLGSIDSLKNEQIKHKEALAKARQKIQCAKNRFMFSSVGVYGLKTDGTVLTTHEFNKQKISTWGNIVKLHDGHRHFFGVTADGRVVTTGDAKRHRECDMFMWKDIIDVVSCEEYVSGRFYPYTIGLKSDGTLVSIDEGKHKQCDVSSWKDIRSIVSIANRGYTVGLKADGTLAVASDDYELKSELANWKNIQSLATDSGGSRLTGIKTDGTVVVYLKNSWERNYYDVSDWVDVVAVEQESLYLLGLKANGKVVYVAENDRYNRSYSELSQWEDIIDIATSGNHIVGLKADGTVVAVGNNEKGQCDVSAWRDIVAVIAGGVYTFGIKADGTIVVAGPPDEKYDVSSWKLFNHIDTLEDELKEQEERRAEILRTRIETQRRRRQEEQKRLIEEQKRLIKEKKKKEEQRQQQMALWREQKLCQHCGGNFKGLFKKVCTCCGTQKDY